MAIPTQITPIPLDARVGQIAVPRRSLSRQHGAWEPKAIPSDGFLDVLPAGSAIEIGPDQYIVVGALLGEGGQARVYEVAACEHACIKIGRNTHSAKQLRREILGYASFRERGVPCPKILGADAHGRFIIKEKLPGDLLNGTRILQKTNRILPEKYVRFLRNYALRFEQDGIAVDCMPGNIIFYENTCGSYETTTWNAPPEGTWTFAGCFLLEWVPWLICHRSINGWPPFFLGTEYLKQLKAAWENTSEFAVWRKVFGDFPDLCPEWWLVRNHLPGSSEYIGKFPPI